VRSYASAEEAKKSDLTLYGSNEHILLINIQTAAQQLVSRLVMKSNIVANW